MPAVTALAPESAGPAELAGAGATLRRVAVKAGHAATRHHHGFEQFLFVASGRGRLECEAGGIALEPGTALRLEPGAWHSAEFTADTVLIEVNLAPAETLNRRP